MPHEIQTILLFGLGWIIGRVVYAVLILWWYK